MANARDLALAETLNNDRFPIEVDITEDVAEGRIDQEDLAEAMGGKTELKRLKRELREASTALDELKLKEKTAQAQMAVRKNLLKKQVQPKNDNERKLLQLTDDKVQLCQ